VTDELYRGFLGIHEVGGHMNIELLSGHQYRENRGFTREWVEQLTAEYQMIHEASCEGLDFGNTSSLWDRYYEADKSLSNALSGDMWTTVVREDGGRLFIHCFFRRLQDAVLFKLIF
jgi:hypothetical protein